MFVWAKVSQEHLSRFNGSTTALCIAMVDQAEVAITPGAAFGDLGEGYVRLALVENEQRIRQALRQMGRALGVADGNPQQSTTSAPTREA